MINLQYAEEYLGENCETNPRDKFLKIITQTIISVTEEKSIELSSIFST